MITHSIKRNLLVWLLVPLLTLLAMAGGRAYYAGINIANAAYDRALYDSVLTLGILVKSTDGKVSVDLPPIARRMLEVDPMDSIYYAVKSNTGDIIIGDADLQVGDLSTSSVEAPVFFDSMHRGKHVRIAVAEIFPQGDDTHPVVVEVAETLKKRQVMAQQILQQSIAPQILFLTVAIIMVWFAVYRALQPLIRVSDAVNQRSALDFSPLPQAAVPEEIRPLTTAFNNLMQRFEASFTTQKRFVANAAHQLRTPVAGMRAIIEAERMGQPPGTALLALERLHKSVIRMSRLVTQLLSLSRAEPGYPVQLTTLDLSAALEGIVEEYRDLAHDRRIKLQADIRPGIVVQGVPLMLSEMVGNLIDNALRYSPGETTVSVQLTANHTNAVLEIADEGPGIPSAEVNKVFERFYRGEHVTQEGSGLGLAIVKEIADIHGARIRVTANARRGGTRIFVELGRTHDGSAAAY